MFCIFLRELYSLPPYRFCKEKDGELPLMKRDIVSMTRYDPFSEFLPKNHGVYTIFSHDGVVKYVGSSNDIHTRMSDHARSGILKQGDTVKVLIFSKNARQKKLLNYEKTEIKRLEPLYNKHPGTPGKSWHEENVAKLGIFYKINKNNMEINSRKIIQMFLDDGNKKGCKDVIKNFLRIMKHFK